MKMFSLMTKWVVVSCLTAGFFSSYADTTTNKWTGSLAAGLTMTRGNSQTTLATLVAGADYKTAANEWLLGANGTYGKSQVTVNGVTADTTTAQNADGFVQFNHLFTERAYIFSRVEGYHDDLADIHYRVTISLGPGYYFIKNTNTDLSAELGPGFVSQCVGTDEENFATIRAAQKFHQKLSDRARLWETFEITPDLGDFSNYLIAAEIGVGADLTQNKALELQCFLDDNYNSKPAPGRVSNDVRLVVAIGYKF
jgi:putative salt-induced outer membrane protein YdiY